MITIVDYGAGNLHSVYQAIVSLGYQVRISTTPKEIINAKVVILPGVGTANAMMTSLEKQSLIGPIKQVIAEDRPFFGVCLGLHVLLSVSEEGGWHNCLNIIPGSAQKLPEAVKVPHIGWNQVYQKIHHPIFKGISDGANFYFVHSYYAIPDDRSVSAAETEYGVKFCSMILRGNLIATQFHPEKSGELGLRLYRNFLESHIDN